MIITREATPSRIEDPGRQAPEQRSMTRHGAIHPRRAQALDGSMSTEELLGQLARLPGEHPARAQLRARAVERNLPLAAQLARRYAGRGELLDDLTQVAAVALIQAVDRYDPSRGVPFAGFAIPSILGALKRHFRDTAWGPSGCRDRSRNLRSGCLRPPTNSLTSVAAPRLPPKSPTTFT